MAKKLIFLSAAMLLLIACVVGILLFHSNETSEIESQEMAGEMLADKYLINVYEQEDVASKDDTQLNNNNEFGSSELEYDDNEIYSYFDETYASGYIDCVLEIPAIKLRQSIFSGTPSQIEHDLSKWLSVTARSDYVLGDTHYCIYMHNPRNKSTKISQAQEDLQTGDYMIVTQDKTVYLYEITSIFPEWRNKCTDNYVNNMSIGGNKLYIFTCGRGEWQGRNLVIEGSIFSTHTAANWVKHSGQYIDEYKNRDNGDIQDPEQNKDQLDMDIKIKGKSIAVSIHNKNYTNITNCSIGICNNDGYLIDEIPNPIEYVGQEIILPQLPIGEYYIGVYDNNTTYRDPTPYKIVIDAQTSVKNILQVDQENEDNNQKELVIKIVAMTLLCIAIIVWSIAIIKIIRKKSK